MTSRACRVGILEQPCVWTHLVQVLHVKATRSVVITAASLSYLRVFGTLLLLDHLI